MLLIQLHKRCPTHSVEVPDYLRVEYQTTKGISISSVQRRSKMRKKLLVPALLIVFLSGYAIGRNHIPYFFVDWGAADILLKSTLKKTDSDQPAHEYIMEKLDQLEISGTQTDTETWTTCGKDDVLVIYTADASHVKSKIEIKAKMAESKH